MQRSHSTFLPLTLSLSCLHSLMSATLSLCRGQTKFLDAAAGNNIIMTAAKWGTVTRQTQPQK